MAEVFFYHLTQSRLEDALPGLIERSLQRGWYVNVCFPNVERRDALDQHLWEFAPLSFIAHGGDDDDHKQEHPVYLTTDSMFNPNDAQVCFCVEGADYGEVASYQRFVVMFNGHDAEQLANARQQWKSLKQEGHQLTYWQQSSDRRWEKKA